MNTIVLRFGAKGAAAKQLQKALAEHGFRPGKIDGDFGGGTEAALMAFQRSRGLLPDGVAGPRTQAALGMIEDGRLPRATGEMSVQVASRMCPFTPLSNIKANLPLVMDSLERHGLQDRTMVLMAVASIRAETESFLPISEGRSKFNTSPDGAAFDLYDHRSDLGNQGSPDGQRYRGRGFIQLTGRFNYERFGAQLNPQVDLVAHPELANASDIAADLLSLFLKSRELNIKDALLHGNLQAARRLVNGGTHGLDRFTEAFKAGDAMLPS